MKRRKNQGLKESLYMVCKRIVNGCDWDFTEDPYENVIRELICDMPWNGLQLSAAASEFSYHTNTKA
jgi:hypothetical protein